MERRLRLIISPVLRSFFRPIFRGTEGVYYSNLPSFRSGNYIDGVRLSFEKGTVKKAEAKSGEAFTETNLNG